MTEFCISLLVFLHTHVRTLASWHAERREKYSVCIQLPHQNNNKGFVYLLLLFVRSSERQRVDGHKKCTHRTESKKS